MLLLVSAERISVTLNSSDLYSQIEQEMKIDNYVFTFGNKHRNV